MSPNVDDPLAACPPGSHCGRKEHSLWSDANERIGKLLSAESARRGLRGEPAVNQSFAFTTLRAGNERVISHWAFLEKNLADDPLATSSGHGGHRPPPDVALYSTESLRFFLHHHVNGVETVFFRSSNLQIAELASVPLGTPVNRSHLEQAKAMLNDTQAWALATVECMPMMVMQLSYRVHGVELSTKEAEALIEHSNVGQDKLTILLDSDVLAEAAMMNLLDMELHEWALSRICGDDKFDELQRRRQEHQIRVQSLAPGEAVSVVIGSSHTFEILVVD